MTKKELLIRIEASHEQFLDSIDGLSDTALTMSGVNAEWSVKDVLAHLSRWEAELVKLLWQVQQGNRPTTLHFDNSTNVDQINDQWFKEAQGRPLVKVLEDFHAVHNQTLLRLEGFSENDLSDRKRFPGLMDRPLLDFISGDTYEHEEEHIQQILTWRTQQGM